MHLTDKNSKIFVAGHRGLVGSAIVQSLQKQGFENLVLRTRQQLDLCNQAALQRFFESEQPEFVVLAAAKVGGIMANNTYPADFVSQNLQIQQNIIQAAHDVQVKRLIFLGSSCIYPKLAPQPLQEISLLTGPLEPTNEWYAIAKIAGIKMCQAFHKQYGDDFISLMPTNMYGPGDNFDLQNSHVLPALIRKFHEAKGISQDVILWGTGTPRREFLYSTDLAEACVFVLKQPEQTIDTTAPDRILNIGYGEDLEIRALAELVKQIVGGDNNIIWDTSKPDGTPRKFLDATRMFQLGWRPTITLEDGIKKVYKWYTEQVEEIHI